MEVTPGDAVTTPPSHALPAVYPTSFHFLCIQLSVQPISRQGDRKGPEPMAAVRGA